MNGVITIPNLGRFQVEYTRNGKQNLNELDPGQHPVCRADQLPKQSRSDPGAQDDKIRIHSNSSLAEPTNSDSNLEFEETTIIDVMFLYTEATLDSAGGEACVLSLADLAIAEANAVHRNSKLPVRANLIHIQETEYRGSGSILTDAMNLGSGSGLLSNVPALRLQYGADLVSLIVETDDDGWVGIANTLKNPRGDSNRFESVLNGRWIATGRYVFAHEMAHNLGCQHDRRNAKNSLGELSPGLFSYSLGYRFESEAITHTTVMAYSPGIAVPYFSDPTATYGGVEMGRLIGDSGEADNASTVRVAAPLVANYRNATSWYEFGSLQIEIDEDAEIVSVPIHRRGDLSEVSSVHISTLNGTAVEGNDYIEKSERVTFPVGISEIAVTIEMLPDDLQEGPESFALALAKPDRSARTISPARTEITINDDDWSLEFEQKMVTVFEADQTVRFPVNHRRNISSEEVLSYRYEISSSHSAQETPSLFLSGMLDFNQTRLTNHIDIQIMSDSVPESDETLTVTLGPMSATVRVLDDDRSGSLDPSFTRSAIFPGGLAWGLKFHNKDHLFVGGAFGPVGDPSPPAILNYDSHGQPSAYFSSPSVQAQRLPSAARSQALTLPQVVTWDGKVLVTGVFASFNGLIQPNLARLDRDGSFDSTFRPRLDGRVFRVRELADGRIMASGKFEHVNGVPQNLLTRLLEDGSIDPTYQPGEGIGGFAGEVNDFVLQPDGRIVIGGRFETVSGRRRRNIARLHPDGSLDESFDVRRGVNGPINLLHLLRDGRIYVSGEFTRVAGESAPKLARLLPNGSLDSEFAVNRSLNRNITQIQPLPDGRLFVSGEFVNYGATRRGRILLLNEDGTLDESFDPGLGADDVVLDLAIHGDGWLYLCGFFDRINGVPAPRLARLKTDLYSPEIVSIHRRNETAQILIDGFHGSSIRLQSSSNLKDWKNQGEYELEAKQLAIETIIGSGEGSQFFRLGEVE